MATTQEKWQEIANRGLQDKLSVDVRPKFDEAVKRGLITMPDQQVDQVIDQEMETEQVIEPIAQQPIEPSLADQAVGGLETAATVVSSAVAEPIAGLRGIYEQVTGGDPTQAIQDTREALTYQGGEESQKQLQSIGETLAPVGEALSTSEKFLGESVLDITGSPALAAIAHSLPTAALEIIGVKGSKVLKGAPKLPTQKAIKSAIVESAPEVDAIKNASRAIYKEIDDSGVTIKPESINTLVNKVSAKTRRKGLDPRVTPQASGALEALKEIKNTTQPITELDVQRNIAQKVAGSADQGEAMLGNMIIDEIDDFMDTLKPKDLLSGKADTGKKYQTARKLWGRAKRSEMITDAIKTGESRAAGAEAGIRNELNRLLNNKKTKKFIPKDEQAIMRDVVDGDFKQNFTRLIGKTGISIDRSPGVFQAMMASGSAGLGGLFGLGAGGIVIPVIGSVSKKIAQNLTRNKAKFVDSITRAGTNAEEITKAYLTSVPKAKRSVQDLADLLSDPEVNLTDLKMIANETFKDALDLAKGQRAINLAAGALAGESAQATKQESK